MDISFLKAALPPVFNSLCGKIRLDDAVIDWVDVVFEQVGSTSRCPPHAHTWFELNYVLRGEMETRFQEEAAAVREGQFFLIPPGLVHSHAYNRESPHEGICLRWRHYPAEAAFDPDSRQPPGKDNASFLGRLERLYDWRPGAYTDEWGVGELFAQLFREGTEGQGGLSLQLLLVRILERISRTGGALPEQAGENAWRRDPLVRKVEVYLEDAEKDRLNMTDLAASLHMSYGHLSRLYKQRTGRTIVERMNQIRLGKAKELLLKTELPVGEVAEQAGFPDLCYFSRLFKKEFGLSPLHYRKRQGERTEAPM
ncbi:AraC family transcriptional regulator [Paenibacillus sp. YN15]|uniref:AraC family transcriptional regulator n=1 Tax=Paenibacillus sp. YN15 TaxID=1742774 RepID=UPI0015EB623F|nr:AraC family transcriptional regulator [Paenibacillus sp. YN15]